MTGKALLMPLRYTTPAKMAEYRDEPAARPHTMLVYDAIAAADVLRAPLGKVQARFQDHIVFRPRFIFKGNVRVNAVIDRMMVLFVTRNQTSWSGIRAALEGDDGRFPYVSDREAHARDFDWSGAIELPTEMKSADGTGRVFAVLFQEPTPRKLSRALAAVAGKFGIVGKVVPYLIELAIDFYPRSDFPMELQTQVREEMVGLLQRNHCIRKPEFSDFRADARQVYESFDLKDAGEGKTNYLFSSPGNVGRKFQDHEVNRPHVVHRLEHSKTPNQMFLDATVYKGWVADGLLIRIQHKIRDEQNRATGTFRVLPIEERRARIEAEISGPKWLWDDLQLRDVNDLSALNFRSVRKRYLEFWLPTASSTFSEQIMVRKQLEDRGVYGVEIMKSLEKHQEKQKAKKRSGLPGAPAIRDRTGAGSSGNMVAWTECNDRVGDALDAPDGLLEGLQVVEVPQSRRVASSPSRCCETEPERALLLVRFLVGCSSGYR